MRMAFCTPFKPLDHSRVSGDVTIARDLAAFLERTGHRLVSVPYVNMSRIWFRPWRWPRLAWNLLRSRTMEGVDLWFSYHSYYKAPDILGCLGRRRGLPYAILAASDSPRRGRSLATLPGHLMNRLALRCADRIFCNKLRDLPALRRLLPEKRLVYIPPGIRV